MSKKAHTEGPWKVIPRDETPGFREPTMVDTGEGLWEPKRDFNSEANARLIAAAPDLMEALEQNVSAFMTLAGFGPEIKALIGDDGWSKIADTVQASRAALSKATGGE